MQTRSFFRMFRGLLTLVIVGTIGMTAQLVYTIATWRSSSASILLMGLAVYFIYSFVRGLQERDFRDWNRAVLDGEEITEKE
jgi:putative Mn2+ efflux pump MntP